jgi:hypothetical protein
MTLAPISGTGYDPLSGGSLTRQQDRSIPGGAYRLPEEGPLPDLRLYERLIADGVAEADARGSIVDHVTARRLAIWLAARPQAQVFARSLVRFIETGAVSEAFKAELRKQARTRSYQPQATKLLQYCAGRQDNLGPIDKNFGRACDDIDRADAMLVGLREWTQQGVRPAEKSWQETQAIAFARRDPASQRVTLVLDAASASVAMFAITAHADEREAHVREVERFGESLPEGSYGRRNRQAIAARERRIAARLRIVENAFRLAIERDAVPSLPLSSTRLRHADLMADREVELE